MPQHHSFAAAAVADWSAPLQRHLKRQQWHASSLDSHVGAANSGTAWLEARGGLLLAHVAPVHVLAAAEALASQALVMLVCMSSSGAISGYQAIVVACLVFSKGPVNAHPHGARAVWTCHEGLRSEAAAHS